MVAAYGVSDRGYTAGARPPSITLMLLNVPEVLL